MPLVPAWVRIGGLAVALAVPGFVLAPTSLAQPLRLTEDEAVARVLADPDFVTWGEARRSESASNADSISRFQNPSLTLSQSHLVGPAGEETEWELRVSQPIDITGRRKQMRAAARAEAGAVSSDVDRRIQLRIAEVRRAYALCAAAQERADLSHQLLQQLQRAERIVSARAQAGDSAVYDLRRVRVEARLAEADALLSTGEGTADCTSLEQLTGLPDVRPADRLNLTSAMVLPPAGRPDLRAREQRVAAAGDSRRAAERARFPVLSLGVGYRRIETPFGVDDGAQLSIGATIPLFGVNAAVREARAREQAAAAELALARRALDAEVLTARVRAEAAHEAALATKQALADAERLSGAAEVAYQTGEIGIAEWLDAYRAAHSAHQSTIEMTGRAILAAIELDLAQGGILP